MMNGDSHGSTAGRAGVLFGLAGLITTAALALGMTSAGAVEYGNPDYLGILRAQPPTGFPVSPAALNLGQGPVTVTFGVPVTNLTKSSQTVAIDFSVHHILTYKGQDISDGQPGQAGIIFPPGAPNQTTQALYGPRQSASFTVPAGQTASTVISFTAPISICGYFQIDFNSPTKPAEYLAAGFTRALGCVASPSGPTTTTSTAAPSAVLGTTVTTAPATTATSAAPSQVLGLRLTAPAQLPATGASPLLFGLAAISIALGIVLLSAARLLPRQNVKVR